MITQLFNWLKPLVFKLDPELAHSITIKALARGLYPKDKIPVNTRLAQTVFGIRFSNPVGLAAGFDKNAEALTGLFALGFDFIEAGTVTPRPQAGNPRPRVFRDVKSQSVINRMGFPGHGAEAFLKNYLRYRAGKQHEKSIVGINIGKNKDTQDPAADYLTLATMFAPHADYLAINISSPNTAGLRDLQKRDFLLPFIAAIKANCAAACGDAHVPPILVKLAPDLSDPQLDELAETLLEAGVDGVILTNTTLDRPITLPETFTKQTGGLSGPHVRDKSTAIIHRFYDKTGGKIPIIGVGGISTAAEAYAKIRAGASLVQVYTGLIFKGPAIIEEIKEGLTALLDRDGYRTLAEAVGSAHK